MDKHVLTDRKLILERRVRIKRDKQAVTVGLICNDSLMTATQDLNFTTKLILLGNEIKEKI